MKLTISLIKVFQLIQYYNKKTNLRKIKLRSDTIAVFFYLFVFSPNVAIGQFEKWINMIGWEMWLEFKIVNRSKNTTAVTIGTEN